MPNLVQTSLNARSGFFLNANMKKVIPLEKVSKRIDISNYSLSEYAVFLASFENKTITIVPKDKTKATIKVLLSKDQFAHLIGLQYCYGKQVTKSQYKGLSGFELLEDNSITIKELERNFNKNKVKDQIDLTWKHNILPKIEWFPCFLNQLERKEYKLCLNTSTVSHMRGDYLLFKLGKDEYLILSLIKAGQNYKCESFISNSPLIYFDPDNEIEIESIQIL